MDLKKITSSKGLGITQIINNKNKSYYESN